MGCIRSLPPEVVAKIAAGEVVERPASVAKELLENALDAGSRKIRVELSAGGRELIRVIDDGQGMGRDDALLAPQRYSTSKISAEGDLFDIRTFGFRGEALASIAAVSRLKITTRRKDEMAGTVLKMDGGGATAEEIGCPPGTSVEVSDLFFNIPARRKFLKSPRTELGQIGDLVARLALANPGVHFQLLHEEKLLAHYPVREDESFRLAEALGREAAGRMHRFRFHQGGVEVTGYAAEPGYHKASSRGIYLFVNRRPVRDRLLSHGVMEAYRNFLPRDRYPVAIVFVEIPPAAVDVNVHPGKWEVKFAASEEVHRSVVLAVRGMLERAPWLKENGRMPEIREAQIREASPRYPSPAGFSGLDAVRLKPAGPLPDAPAERPGEESPIFLWQMENTYLLFAAEDGLLLLDQHAAHERVLFERIKSEIALGGILNQPLLIPEVVEFSLAEAQAAVQHLSDLAAAGFELEPFGERSFWIKAVPQILAAEEPLPVMREMVQLLSAWGKNTDLRSPLEPWLHLLACHGAVQASQALGRAEAEALLRDLRRCTSPACCPHGRPTMQKIAISDLERMFRRK